MNSAEHICVWVDGVGVIGPGIANWAQAQALLRGEASYESAPTALPAPELLPPAERRRASRIVKAALAVGLEACRNAGLEPRSLPNVFAASGGDGHNCHALCELLASEDRQISPTRFHNSVHNAASGYWSIATGATPAAQVLGAYDASFAAGLLEAMSQVEMARQAVLLVACDSEYPEPLHAKRPIQDTSGLALVLAPVRSERSIAQIRMARRGALQERAPSELAASHAALADCVRAMPAMRGLPLAQALIAQASVQEIALEYFSPQSLVVQVAGAEAA
ncbi:beta-ketoacyl synthase chain length factor [Ottowia thiooxydans]|uniref:beta-ketoacyl synthase chain length factor n=1 Tax=Ottowia thiooxydans TaxID=219182 RepID=UPI00040465D9|nr:beta-ketoacyl synthase chain length factor [Ottowia thiooxydans]